MRGGPAWARYPPRSGVSTSMSSVTSLKPSRTNNAPNVDLPKPLSATNATAPRSVSTAVACNGSRPRRTIGPDERINEQIGQQRLVVGFV